jgi:hypothetical protein
MNWIKFAVWLSGIYVVYYLALILWDMIRSSRGRVSDEPHQLTFAEHTAPVQKDLLPAPELSASSILSSGGVNLKQLFSLAREEAIEFTRAVSF